MEIQDLKQKLKAETAAKNAILHSNRILESQREKLFRNGRTKTLSEG